MKELDIIDGIDPRTLIEEGEVYVPWAEFGVVSQEVGLKLARWIKDHGPIDIILYIKHGAGHMVANLERTVPRARVRSTKMHRQETGLTLVDNPPPVIDYFPEDEDFSGKTAAIFDEVFESGKSMRVAVDRVKAAGAARIITVVLDWKPACGIYPDFTPDIWGRQIDPAFRCYPWELWERVMAARIKQQEQAAAVA